MAETPKSSTSPAVITLSLLATTLGLTLIWAWRTAGTATADLSPEAAEAAGALGSNLLLGFFVGAALSLIIVGWRSRMGAGAAANVDAVWTALVRGDSATAAESLRAAGGMTQAAEEALTSLAAGGGAGVNAAALDAQRRGLETLAGALTSLGETLAQQKESLDGVRRAADENRAFLKDITANVDGLSRSAEETSSSILEMVATNNEVTENIHNLAQSVQETTTAIEEMTFSIKEVARNIEELSTAAEETAASMNQMDVSISQVETNANETSRLSETVSVDAETGVTAINRTIQGIDRIKESSKTAAEVIGTLGKRINEIGNILTVIDDVAEQTNLLALNAAIIAAQAGEHGRGFAVVADEIKALAERTGSSTKEIADLIKTVQAESRNAISTMSQGVEAVEEGVSLGHNAEEALLKIVDSAKRSTLMIKAIAQATVEQAKGSKQVTNAISRIAETVQQIALATSEQAKGSEQIMKSAERMRVITQQVERSTEEQNRGGQQVTEAVETIRGIVDRVSQAQDAQLRNNEKLAEEAGRASEAANEASSVRNGAERELGTVAAGVDALNANN